MSKTSRIILIAVSLFFCLPLGFAVWHYSKKSEKLVKARDFDFALYYRKLTYQLTTVAFIMGLLSFYFVYFWILN
ncbi:hypothetical protein EMN47_06260 [Prolixibacteraceae bacterium JC049]|nr:hypothetical protein [Prolixibacteraceae bacterium JC049]